MVLQNDKKRTPSDVAIIGAGVSGLILALALRDKNIKSTVYELRSESYNNGGAIMLCPNSLRALDSIGKPRSVYKQICAKAFKFDALYFVDEDHKILDVYYFGSEKMYGYPGVRVHRHVLIDVLVAMCRDRDIPIHYSCGFSNIISESAEGSITFALTNGEEITTDFLVGADGIQSKVRSYISSVEPEFSGILGISTQIQRSAIRDMPPDYPLCATIISKSSPAFLMVPQNPDGSETFFGFQCRYPDIGREGWTALRQDKQKLHEMMLANKQFWRDDSVVNAHLDAVVDPSPLNIWPFYQLPRLESWSSQKPDGSHGGVVILGDAAHAIPPSGGQGANQAIEDAYTLAVLLANLDKPGVSRGEALDFWHEWRQARVDRVIEITSMMNAKRLPEAKKKEVENPRGDKGQLGWLYNPRLDEEMDAWVRKQGGAALAI